MLSTVYYWYNHCGFDPIIVSNAKDKIRLEQKEGLQSEYHMPAFFQFDYKKLILKKINV